MRRKLTSICAALAAAAGFLTLHVSVASATVPHGETSPAQALCESRGGDYEGPNWVWRLDTTFMTNAGYGCLFFDGTTEATLLNDPRTAGARGLCGAYGGGFYTFEALASGPSDVLYAGWGCMFIFI